MLWGGLLMLVALLLLLGFLGKQIKSAAAFIGGLGFGTFIDELGKFLTHDNNYFFRPTFALIYILFVLLYVVWSALHRRTLTRTDALANALELMLEAVRKDMDVEERRRPLALLAQCDPADPVAASLARALAHVELARPGRPGPLARGRRIIRRLYRTLVQRRWFPTAVITFFVMHSIIALVQAMTLFSDSDVAAALTLVIGASIGAGMLLHPSNPERVTRVSLPAAVILVLVALAAGAIVGQRARPVLAPFEWAGVISSVVPAFVVLLGVARLRRSRLQAYRIFNAAVLFIIFVTQFFAFYQRQLVAVFGLAANILVWLTLRTIMQQERRLRVTDGGVPEA